MLCLGPSPPGAASSRSLLLACRVPPAAPQGPGQREGSAAGEVGQLVR